MPTRRTMALVLAVAVLSRPVLGAAKLWATRQLAERNDGLVYGAAEIMSVVL